MDNRIWIEEQWGQAQLGDARRNHRAVKLAEDLLNKPSASLPQQCSDWAALKAAYRFFNEKDVTFEALQQPHREHVIGRARQSEIILFLQDGSELDYTSHDIDLGPIGDHRGHGFFLHTTMAVEIEKENRKVIGIAHQILWEREKVKKKETRAQRRARANEADVWTNSVKAIGQAPSDCLWINIGDRGADIFEFLETCRSYNHHVVIRMIQNRKVVAEGQEGKILEILKQKTSQGMFELHRRGRNGEPNKIHHLHLSWSSIEIQPPQYVGKTKAPILGTYIRVWEEEPGGLEWILFTSLPVNNFEEAFEKAKLYAMRWMIEEYHKCLKTGCNVEKRNFHSGRALEALIGMLGIIASKILELKYLSKREDGKKPAKDFISEDLIAIISRRYKLDKMKITLKEFWNNVAKLGGFLGRKNDGDPGWQTLWKGWIRLLDMQEALEEFQKCG